MRVLTVLEILQARERVSAAELARRLEVSSRTVQRYIARLQDLGIPVGSTRGRGAEYLLGPSYRMPPIMFSSEEAFAVALGLAALAPAVVGVDTKLARVLPTAIWARMQALSAALQLEKADWLTPVDTALITDLASAIQQRLQVAMQYQNYQQIRSQRTVQPLGLVRAEGIWHLSAYCLSRQDFRLFHVDRISRAHLTQTTFEFPANFNAERFNQERLQNIPKIWKMEVWLEANSETFYYDLLPPRASLAEEDGGLVLRCGVNDLVQHAARLLELGCRFGVRSPLELKSAFQEG
jgi:predicted DNA-binding transcriptional regulator YafY